MPKTKTPISNNINPSLISLKPRQVLLANINMKQSNANATTASLKPEQKALLLHSVAAYLNSNGFAKTLKKFLSEAKLEKDDFSDSSLDLEDIFCKHLASCDHGSTNFSRQKVQDLLMDGNSARDEESGKITESKVIEEVIVDDAVPELNKKSKEKKKSKKISNSLSHVEHINADKLKKPVVDNMVCDTEFHESEKKHKEKKKKKSKLDSESFVNNVELIAVEDKQETKTKEVESLRDYQAIETKMVNANSISLEGETVKSKSKKKKKDGSASQSLSDGDKELDGGKLSITVSEKDNHKTSEEDATIKESKHLKKRKRLAAEENNSQPIEKIEVEEAKRRKTEGSEEPKGSSQVTEVKTPIGASDHVDNGSDILKSSLHKTLKEQTNGSTQPKTAKEAFKRVKVDEVVFTDERLKDNSYWAKDGADSGYGAKAQEVLGQVRGRDFRHEKTKKKRGSYRGGQIDLQSHSVKFSYSDED